MSRGATPIVARREFVERGRDRGFLISTAVTVVVLCGLVVAGALFARETTYDLALVGPDAQALGPRVVSTAAALEVTVRVRAYPDDGAAEAAVRDGEVDAAVAADGSIVVRSDPPDQLVAVVRSVSARARSEAALAEAGLTQDQIAEALTQPPVEVRALEPLDKRRRELSTVAFVGVLVLYGQLFAYGYWVAAGVVEEKSSRVVEVLLSTVKASRLLRGKILGIGALGLCQLLLIGAAGLATASAVGSLSFPAGASGAIALVVFWFVLGFFFYAALFAVAGSIVPRQEDLQSTMTPLTILIVVSFLIGVGAVEDPSSTLATVASLLPFSSPLVMPSRIVLGAASAWEVAASVAISVASTLALVPLATRIYERAVLRPGRVRLRQVIRADRAV
jgi:ABC-2 type transport system permease protein